jgi:KDO2-lipid IV(A) lauroyltransferase
MAQWLMRLAARLPLGALHAAGAALGWLMYLASPRYRRHLVENLAAAGYGADRGLRRRAIAEAGRMVVELPAIWLRPRAEALQWIHAMSGDGLVEAARAAGKAVVFFTPHHGCFEITAKVAAEHFPITVLYRPPKLKFLQPVIEEGRAQHNVRLAPANVGGVREMLSALRRGEAVGILPDQVPGEGEGEWADFFGKPAYTMTLAMKLAARPNTVAFLAFGRRLAAGRGFEIHVRELPAARPGETPERRLNRAIEDLVRECPEQYLWGYNRYKRPRGASA